VKTPPGNQDVDGGVQWAAADDATLLGAIARGVEPAIGEFYRRFVDVLMAVARRHGVPAAERRSRAAEFLDDAALRLAAWRHPVPRSLVAYLATSFRRRLGMDWRAETRESHRHGATLSQVADGSQWVIAEMCSEYAIRSATSPDAAAVEEERGLPDDARAELAHALWTAMSEEEQRMMGYLAERYPQREIAERLGLTPTTARVRIMRLRQRLRKVAAQYIATLSVEDGIALARALATPRARIAGGRRQPATEVPRWPRQDQRQLQGHNQRPRHEEGRQPGGQDHE
jgi:RNA polymerase sigma factor (sigma-70 family)